jgi:dihydrolipoamide dehydrogenase
MVGEYVSTGKRSRSEDMTKMVIIFSDPQIMIVGDNFNERIHFSGTVDFSDQGRSRVDGVKEGFLDVYFDKESKLLKGAQMSGPSAEHIAHLLTWSIEMGATLDKLLKMPFYHPVVEEGLRTALRDAASKI